MNLIITGLPGVGKGTQANKIVEKYDVKHLSTGDLFRNEIKKNSDKGQELKKYMDAGNLVPDKLTIEIFKNELVKPIYKNGFLLDGFPRTLEQSRAFDEMLVDANIKLDGVIALDLAEDIIIERITNRLVCPKCGKTYHKLYIKPKKTDYCDVCDMKLIQRSDDKLEAIENRLKIANSQTKPVIDHYNEKNLVNFITMKKTDDTNVVFSMIENVLDRL